MNNVQLKEALELLHKTGAVPQNIVLAVNNLIGHVEGLEEKPQSLPSSAKHIEENVRLLEKLEEAKNALHRIGDGQWEETMDDQFNDVFTTRRINPEQIVNEALASIGEQI